MTWKKLEDSPDLLTLGEVAAILRVTPTTLRRWMATEHAPPAFKMKGTWRFDHTALQEWLAKRTTAGEAQ